MQERFRDASLDVVCATVAFGLGIDVPDIRFVIHTSMPPSIENYHQETGRAGRDGNPAECLLIWSELDFETWNHIIDEQDDSDDGAAHQRLMAMLSLCNLRHYCRRRALLDYFGQSDPQTDDCRNCDVCLRMRHTRRGKEFSFSRGSA